MPSLSPSRVLRAAADTATTGIKWSETLNLPKSSFPARASPAQLAQYRERCADDLYAWQKANRPSIVRDEKGQEVNNEFILHDGPPYANGAVHVGHALNKVLKDVIIRWQLTKGKKVTYRPGWDCHGLPIELKALQAMGTDTKESSLGEGRPAKAAAIPSGRGMTAQEIRKIAGELAVQTIEEQKKSFREWGVMGEWDSPYKTMDPEFEVGQLGVFRDMVQKGLISRHHRPVYWSPSSRTALAEAELEYDDNHKCTAAFVKMPLTRLPGVLRSDKRVQPERLSALIWTTTPWTLPANRAVAVNPDLEYAVVSYKGPGQKESSEDQLLVARDRLQHVHTHLDKETYYETIVQSVLGSELADGEGACYNLFSDSESPILSADFVTATSGTGLVHMAPGHGMEDYLVCQQHKIGPAVAPVDDEGQFTAEAFSAGGHSDLLKGLEAQYQGVKAVTKILAQPSSYLPAGVHSSGSSLVLATHKFTHKYPIDWRTKQPVIIRATAQWFADVSAIRDRALRALDGVTFIPEAGKRRLDSFVQGRSQWCISRQRAWGVPIPVVYNEATGEPCLTSKSIDHIINTVRERGTDAWFSDPLDEKAWIHPSLREDVWVRGRDTMDVWFDSGTTWTTLMGRQSDVYLEGSDQHRGWFQSSLLTSISTQEADSKPEAPYRTLITHGFTLDADGRKMSKSLGNVISPEQIISGSLLPPIKVKKQKGAEKTLSPQKKEVKYDSMGPDVLRLWAASSDYTGDVSISERVLYYVQQSLQKYRVTFKFLLGVLSDAQGPASDSAIRESLGSLSFADQAILDRLSRTSRSVYQAYEEYKFHKAVIEINAFVNSDLSSFYFEVIKDRMYAGSFDVRQRTQLVLSVIMRELLQMLGPLVPHLVEETWENMPPAFKSANKDGEIDWSLHPLRQVWTGPLRSDDFGLNTSEVQLGFEVYKAVSTAVKVAQEDARDADKLRSGLACNVLISLPLDVTPTYRRFLTAWAKGGELADLLVVSQASLQSPNSQVNGDSERPSWQYSQNFDTGAELGVVHVIPPEHHKCVRCWKYTAEVADAPCARCIGVVDSPGSNQ